MKILIVYATYSGSTLVASQTAAATLTELGHTVEIKEVKDTAPSDLTKPDALVMASPSWDYYPKPGIKLEGQPHADFIKFIEQLKEKPVDLANKPCVVLGLGDSSYTFFCGAVTHLENILKRMKGKLVQDSLKIDGFFFNEAENTTAIKKWVKEFNTKLGK